MNAQSTPLPFRQKRSGGLRGALMPWAAAAALIAAMDPSFAATRSPRDVLHLHLPSSQHARGVDRTGPVNASRGAPAPHEWSSQCVSSGRTDVPDCSVEQRLILKNNGRLLAAVTVTLVHGSNKPTILVQLPLGLALDKGVTLKLDHRGPARLRLQTCEPSGCYAGTVMSAGFLKGMMTGHKLTIGFVSSNHKKIDVPMPLDGFAAAYRRIQ